jgi:hypothetical protein
MLSTEWAVNATANAATATATKSAAATKRHVISCVIVSYETAAAEGLLTITVTIGTTSTEIKHIVHGADVIPLEIRGDVNTAVSAALATGGSGVDGYVTIVGHTE